MSAMQELEKRGLWLSIGGALFMAALGIGFAVLTSSDAVLLDGLFSLVGCVVGVVALRVASLVMRPDDDVFHFGYAAFEPMLNLTKGLLMAFITLFALVSAAADLLHGGREVQAGWALVYAVIAASGCFAIASLQRKLAKKTQSPLLEVDTKNWLVDGALSITVAIAFLTALLLSGSQLAYLLPYVDPSVVIVLVLLSLPIPITIIRENWRQLLGKAPGSAFHDRAQRAVAASLGQFSAADTKIRMQQIGRFTYVQLYIVCGSEIDGQLEAFDQCRDSVAKALAEEFDHVALDVVFTREPRWVATSIGQPQMIAIVDQASVEATETMGDATDASA